MSERKTVTPNELDRLVAEKVMGWNLAMGCWGAPETDEAMLERSMKWRPAERQNGSMVGHTDRWRPSRSIADAWEVVEKMREAGFSVNLTGWNISEPVRVEFMDDTRLAGKAYSPSMPLAVCLAVLKAKGIEVELAEDAP